MGSSGLEPPTSRLSGARSNQLSYEPFFHLAALSVPARLSVVVQLPSYASIRFRTAQACPLVFPNEASASSIPSSSKAKDRLIRTVPGPFGPSIGDDGIRTHDPLLAGQVLSQLSYTPVYEVYRISISSESLTEN